LCCRCFLGSFNREEKSLSKIKGYNDRAKTWFYLFIFKIMMIISSKKIILQWSAIGINLNTVYFI
jgi:hypothetical protein